MVPNVSAAAATTHPVLVVVPVKPLAFAKSRLALPPDQRRELALAFAMDTISALCGSQLVVGVFVVTSDPIVALRVQRPGVCLGPDGGGGLGAALRSGIRLARASRPGVVVAVVPADLPCLRPDDVTRVLSDLGVGEGAFVPDRSGNGTTLLVHTRDDRDLARYGPGSAARHQALGLRRLDEAPVRARHDVDTLEDLHSARVLGAGTATTAVLDALDIPADCRAIQGHSPPATL